MSHSIASAPGGTGLRSLDALPAVAALALMVSLPFLNPIHLVPLKTFFEECLALGLGLAALACIAIPRSPGPVAVPAISIWALAFSFLLLLQPRWSAAVYSQPATIAGLYVLWAAAIMWVGAQMRLMNTERISIVLAAAMLLSAMVGAAAAWIQMLDLSAAFGNWVPPIPFGRASGLLSQSNLHANHLVVGSASLVYLWSERRISSTTGIFCGALLASGIAFAASRAALPEIGWLLIAALWFRNSVPREPGRRPFWAGMLAFIVILAVCSGAAAIIEHWLPSPVSAARSGIARDYLVRLGIYEAAIRIWLSAPISGVGVGGFAWAHYTTPTPWVGDVAMKPELYAHDIVLQLLAETGLVGTAIFGVAIVLWFLASARRTQGDSTSWRAWAVGIVGIELVHSLLEFPLWHAHFLGLAALLMGFCDPRILRMSSGVLSRGLALAAAAIGVLLLANIVRSHQELLYWATMPPHMRADPAVREMERQSVERLRKSLLAPYVEVNMALALPLSRENLEERIRFIDRPLHFWPSADMVQKQVALLAMARKDDLALELVRSLARLQPDCLPDLNRELEGISTGDIPGNSPVRRRVRELAERRMQEQPS